ncbi:MAG: long-chain fatty acid--CoA ligase [Eggerthellaceae bacterium]|nr:long-chain fatty acid--CoA ligase [Eggerthellaceae bacterium]
MSYYDSVRDRSVVQMVRDALAWPDNDVVAIFPSGEFTRDALAQRCDALRDELVGRGVRPQSRVAYVGNPDACIMIAQFAIALAGGVPVPLPERSSQDAWADLVSVTGVSFVVCETGQRAKLAEMMEARALDLPVIEVAPDGAVVSPLGAQSCTDYECTPSDLAEVVLSSGSTGTPKAFAFTQDVEYYFVSTWLQIYGEREGGRFLSVGLSGCMHSLLSCLLRREVFVSYAAPMTAADFARTIDRHRITDAFVPPFILDDLADLYVEGDIDFSSLQRIAYAGQAMPASEKQTIAQKMDCELVQFYGNTESGLWPAWGLTITVRAMWVFLLRRAFPSPTWARAFRCGTSIRANRWVRALSGGSWCAVAASRAGSWALTPISWSWTGGAIRKTLATWMHRGACT